MFKRSSSFDHAFDRLWSSSTKEIKTTDRNSAEFDTWLHDHIDAIEWTNQNDSFLPDIDGGAEEKLPKERKKPVRRVSFDSRPPKEYSSFSEMRSKSSPCLLSLLKEDRNETINKLQLLQQQQQPSASSARADQRQHLRFGLPKEKGSLPPLPRRSKVLAEQSYPKQEKPHRYAGSIDIFQTKKCEANTLTQRPRSNSAIF